MNPTQAKEAWVGHPAQTSPTRVKEAGLGHPAAAKRKPGKTARPTSASSGGVKKNS
jgi:hypothetical protein